MFCMNCGQQLPDGAKFCLQCGTPQGAISSTGTTQAENINLDGNHTFVPAMCPNCNAHMKVDSSSKVARCEACGTECLVQDAIKALTVKGNIQVGNATINVNGTNTDSLLQRAEMMLADGDFDGAMSKCDTVLDSDPTNGKVYFLMLMSDLKCKIRSDLANQPALFDDNQYYIKAIQYGDISLKSELDGYINVIKARDEAKQKIKEKEAEEKLKNPKVGDEIYFGIYNGKKIWWKVLQIKDHMIFIITTDIICRMPYHQSGGEITWSECTLRKWLNNEFIAECFNPMEMDRILPCKLNNDNNAQYGTPGGNPTTDKIFLLSMNESESLFANDQARIIGSWWWLRSPACNSETALCVSSSDGKIVPWGIEVKYDCGIRPAMWIRLDP